MFWGKSDVRGRLWSRGLRGGSCSFCSRRSCRSSGRCCRRGPWLAFEGLFFWRGPWPLAGEFGKGYSIVDVGVDGYGVISFGLGADGC